MIKLLLARWLLKLAILTVSVIGLWFLFFEISVFIDRKIGEVEGSPLFEAGLNVPFQHIPDPRQVLSFQGFPEGVLPSGSETLMVAVIVVSYWALIHLSLYLTRPKSSKYRQNCQ